AHRPRGVSAEPADREVRGTRRRRAGAGTAGDALGVIRIAGLAAERAAADAGRRIFVEIGLAEDDRAGRAQLGHHGGILRGLVVGVAGDGAGRRAHIGGVVVVLYG